MKIITAAAYVLISSSLFLFSSCGQDEKEAAAFKEIEESLLESSKSLDREAEYTFREFSDKLQDYRVKDIGEKYVPEMEKIKELSGQANKKIDSLAKLLSEKNYNVIPSKAVGIYHLYLDSALTINEELNAVFSNWKSQKNQSENYHSLLMANVFLSKLKYNISHTKASVIAYLNSKVAIGCGLGFEKMSTLIGQSSNVLEPGQVLEITAGIGSFSSAAQARVTVNNKLIEQKDIPYASAKIKVPVKPGNYKIPVEIRYTNQNGEDVVDNYSLDYKVVKAIE